MILDKIIENKRKEIELNKKKLSLNSIKNKLKEYKKNKNNFKKSLSENKISLIAEIKKKSPSEGLINKKYDFSKIAQIYNKNKQVKAISVLTDNKFFGGNLKLISKIKKLTQKPILRKDFIIDEYQIYESRYYGADAILLIARILTKKQIEDYVRTAKKMNMYCLIETHNEKEIEKLPKNLEIVGINNRDLDTLKVDLENTKDISKIIRKKFKNAIIVSESGINNNKDIYTIKNDVNGVLIGTSILKSKDINKKINSFFIPQMKVCGITNFPDAKCAIENGADYLGFIFYKKSQRNIKPKIAKEICLKIKKMKQNIKTVGVFVDENIKEIKKIKKLCKLDYIQLHGNEDNNFIKKLNEKNVIKAFRINHKLNNKMISKINNSFADYVLLDTYDKNNYGGTGKSFNYLGIEKIKNKMIFLSGGIGIENINNAIKAKPFAIDVNSGVEKTPGKKDDKKMKKLFKKVVS